MSKKTLFILKINMLLNKLMHVLNNKLYNWYVGFVFHLPVSQRLSTISSILVYFSLGMCIFHLFYFFVIHACTCCKQNWSLWESTIGGLFKESKKCVWALITSRVNVPGTNHQCLFKTYHIFFYVYIQNDVIEVCLWATGCCSGGMVYGFHTYNGTLYIMD